MSESPEDPMKTLLRQMHQGWILYEQAIRSEAVRYSSPVLSGELRRCMTEACGGDPIKGALLELFSVWSNDIEDLAHHYGLRLFHSENAPTVLLEDVPPAPSPQHWWSDGRWHEPEIKPEEVSYVQSVERSDAQNALP